MSVAPLLSIYVQKEGDKYTILEESTIVTMFNGVVNPASVPASAPASAPAVVTTWQDRYNKINDAVNQILTSAKTTLTTPKIKINWLPLTSIPKDPESTTVGDEDSRKYFFFRLWLESVNIYIINYNATSSEYTFKENILPPTQSNSLINNMFKKLGDMLKTGIDRIKAQSNPLRPTFIAGKRTQRKRIKGGRRTRR
jgi:hypothetical protein